MTGSSKFSSKKVIVNEIYGLTAIAVSFFYLNVLKNYILFSEFIYEQYLLIFLIVIMLLFIVIRFLKKKTKVFQG